MDPQSSPTRSSLSRHHHCSLSIVLAAQLFAMAAAEAQPGLIDQNFGDGGAAVEFFDLGGQFTDIANGMTLQPDGKAVLVGSADIGGIEADFGVMRFTANGFLDLSFGFGGKTTVAFDLAMVNSATANDAAIDANGRIVVAGWASNVTSADFAIARLDPFGVLDTTFDGDGRAIVAFDLGLDDTDFATSVAVQPDGKIVVAGSATTGPNTEMAVTRLNVDGSLDTTFSDDGRTTVSFGAIDSVCLGILIQPNGSIVLAGWAEPLSSLRDFAVARLLPNGLPDATFNGSGQNTFGFGVGLSDDFGQNVALDDDGRIVVVGVVVNASSVTFGIARLLPTGDLDTFFGSSGRSDGRHQPGLRRPVRCCTSAGRLDPGRRLNNQRNRRYQLRGHALARGRHTRCGVRLLRLHHHRIRPRSGQP